jgi:hypothetical protein
VAVSVLPGIGRKKAFDISFYIYKITIKIEEERGGERILESGSQLSKYILPCSSGIPFVKTKRTK